MNHLKRLPKKLDSRRIAWALGLWTLEFWTTGRVGSGRLDSGRLDAWTLDAWTLNGWTLGVRKFFSFLLISIFFLLLVNVKFLKISNAPRLMYYGSGERGANDSYKSNLLQLIL